MKLFLRNYLRGDEAPGRDNSDPEGTSKMRRRNAVIKPKHSPTDQTDKAHYITCEAFADLKKALEDALAFERGERRTLKITRVHIQSADNTAQRDRSH
jgi:hypothetical protein